MERSEIRDSMTPRCTALDCAALHPGYEKSNPFNPGELNSNVRPGILYQNKTIGRIS
jgi:hypothetical protein